MRVALGRVVSCVVGGLGRVGIGRPVLMVIRNRRGIRMAIIRMDIAMFVVVNLHKVV